MFSSRSLRLSSALGLALVIACGGEPTSGGSRVNQIIVEPTGPTLNVGESVSLRATLLDAEGRPLTGRAVIWASGNNGVAEISEAGVVTGIQPGLAQVAASSEGQHAITTVTVRARGIATVAVNPTSVTLEVGQSRSLQVSIRDAVGAELQGRTVTWTSSDENVVAVGSDGSVTARAPGAAVITATSEGRSGSAAVAVQAIPVATVTLSPSSLSLTIGQTASVSATPRSGAGSPLAGRGVAWSTSAASVATVTSEGLVTAVGPGQATITGQSEGRGASLTVVVAAIPAASVIVSPATFGLTIGGTQALSATVTDASGAVLTGRPIQWISATPAVATVSAAGVVTAIAVGTAQIRATSEARTGTATVTISAIPVASVSLTPAAAELVVGGSQRFTATMRSAAGAALSGRAITWSSNAPNVASVSSDGTVTALAPGSAVITGTSEGVSGTAVVTVRAVPVASVIVTPASGTLTVGGELQLSAQTRDAQGNALGGRSVAWSSNAPTVALVSSQGRVVAIGPGTAIITASSEGQSAGATITVQQGGVTSVTVSPATASVSVGGTTVLTATGRASSGATVPNRPVTWQSGNEAIARVNSSGQVTGVASGTVTITATIDGVSGGSSVTVTQVPVATVSLTPATLALVVGGTQRLTATVRSAAGVVLTDRPVTWSSNASNVASVSSDGTVTALSPGSAVITGTSEGVSGTATVTVSAAPVTSVIVSPQAATVAVGGTIVLTATGRNSSGATVPNRPVTWQSGNESIARVNASGQVTGVAPGTVTITARIDGVAGTASVTVTGPPPVEVGSVRISPRQVNISVGDTRALSVTVTSASGGSLPNYPVVFTSSNTSVATVSSSGVITGVRVGSVTITANAGGKTDQINVSVRQ